ncbi:hypothetical protein M3Y98_01005000 [Aphelenchoides besseyi]|nr:hypothetical protein M3Y98_01005000 [Aphelenchoides besseyi]KAI6195194.1 hypothetical protein M3Y96_01205100 [Aphelenchoides besseyi]
MLAYRQLIIYNCAVDLLHSTIMLITIEVVEIRQGVLFYVTLSSLIPARLAAPLWVFAILLVILNIPLQFVSRYDIIKNGQSNRTKIVCLYLFLVTLMVIHCLAFPLSCSNPDEFYVNMLREIPTFKNKPPSFYICNDFRDQRQYRLRIFVHGFYSMTIITLCYAVAILAFVKTYRFLADHRVHFSTMTQRVQLQAACPLITHFLPFSLVVFFTILKIQWGASIVGCIASMFSTMHIDDLS